MLPTFLTVLATTLSLLIVDILFPGVVIANFPAALIAGFGVHGIAAFILGPVILSLGNTFINNYFVEKNLALKGSENKAQLPSS